MKLIRTIIYTLLIVGMLVFLIIRHNREQAHTPPRHSAASLTLDGLS